MPKIKLPSPSRVAAYLTALSGLAGAVAVPVANLDLSSTAGVALGVAGVCTAYATWSKGWRAHEEAARADSLAATGERVPAAVVARSEEPPPPSLLPAQVAPVPPARVATTDIGGNLVVKDRPVAEAPDPPDEKLPTVLVEIPDPEAAREAGVPTVFVPLGALGQVVQAPGAAGPRAVSPS